MQHLETCLLIAVDLPTSRAQIFSRARSVSGRLLCFLRKSMIAEADTVLCHLVMFLTVFSTVCTKLNTAAFKILLLFMTGLFIRLLVEKCAACQSHWKSDFGWHSVHFA